MKFTKKLFCNIFTNGVRDDHDDDVKRKILLINLMSEIAIVVLVILSFSNLSSNLTLLFTVDLAAALILIGLLIYLRVSGEHKLVSLIGIYLIASLFFFFFATGGVNNTGYLWYYTFPLFSISILGCKRGMQSVCILLAPSFYLLVYNWPQLTTYSFEFKTRFIPSILVVTIFAYILERTREKKENELRDYKNNLEELIEERTRKLEKALAEIKILKGILPICMHCKKIRDDNGYWNQIEEYIHEHSEAEFTHSLCSECMEEHYPELKERIKKRKQSS